MTIEVKICGLRDAASVAAAVAGDARYVGFVFYPKSPRAVTAEQAAALISQLPTATTSVGLFVDPSDDDVLKILRLAPLQMLQLHGKETPERIAFIKKTTGLPIIKAIGIASRQDIQTAKRYESVADILLLDAKAPSNGLPGGNATSFDWHVLENTQFTKPWMLAGGLEVANIAQAVALTKARILDVSSGVEDALGQKNPAKITAFLNQAKQLPEPYRAIW